MAVNVVATFKGARLVDFTGKVPGFEYLKSYKDGLAELVSHDQNARAIVVIDKAIAGRIAAPVLVRDHLNITGDNPLTGPNPPGCDRFPVVQGIYVSDCPAGMSSGIAVGLKHGVVPDSDDITFIRSLGGDFCCYNIVPAMLIAARYGWKVLAIGVPDNAALSESHLHEIEELTRNN